MVRHNNSLIKKTFAVVALITAFVFFSFNTFAASPAVFNDYSATATNNQVIIKIRAVQFKSSSLGTSMLPGGMESVFFVTCEIENNNTDAAIVNPILFDINLTESKTISHINTFSSDLLIERETYFKIVPSSEFSYDDMIVVPPETTLYFIGEICTTAQLDQTGQYIEDAGLRGIDFVGTGSSYIVGHGDYPYGTAVDLSPVTSFLSTIENDLDAIGLSVQDIEDYITYNGSYVSSDLGAGSYFQLDNTQNSVRTICRVYRGRATYSAVDTYYNEVDDTSHMVGTIRVPFSFYIQINNPSNVQVYYLQYLNNIFPNIANSVHIESFYSDIYEGIIRNGNSNILLKVKSAFRRTGSASVIPLGSHLTFMTGYFDIPADVTYTLPDMTGNTFATYWGSSNFAVVEGYYPIDEYTILKDLYLAYSQVNGLDDSSDLSNDVADVSDSNHIIEESYYSANASAIQATGLSNYHFTNEQNNGISAVSNDFMLLWNALGSWNGVYIFSLTMALATFIMRHGGLFTIKRKVSDKGGEE